MNIDITEPALAKIHQLLAAQGAEGRPVRLAVVRTHCMGGRGHAYRFQLADGMGENDQAVDAGGLSVIIDGASAHLLADVSIDYVDKFEESGFVVSNSNAIGKCPCGHHDLFA